MRGLRVVLVFLATVAFVGCGGSDNGVPQWVEDWSYLGVFLGILSTGIPFWPMPEELPVVVGGFLVGNGSAKFWMLPVCIIAVVIGDAMLYGIGRLWGPRILNNRWIKKHVLPPERLAKIEANFQKHGIKILLFARLTPGIRAPIFVTAGLTKLPFPRFLLADGLYAIPGVTLLFFLGYWFTDSIIYLIQNQFEHIKHIIVVLVVLAVAGYIIYRFLRRPIVTGDPEEVPPIVEQVRHQLEHMRTIMHPKGKQPAPPTMIIPPDKNPAAPDGQLKPGEKKDRVEDRGPVKPGN